MIPSSRSPRSVYFRYQHRRRRCPRRRPRGPCRRWSSPSSRTRSRRRRRRPSCRRETWAPRSAPTQPRPPAAQEPQGRQLMHGLFHTAGPRVHRARSDNADRIVRSICFPNITRQSESAENTNYTNQGTNVLVVTPTEQDATNAPRHTFEFVERMRQTTQRVCEQTPRAGAFEHQSRSYNMRNKSMVQLARRNPCESLSPRGAHCTR